MKRWIAMLAAALLLLAVPAMAEPEGSLLRRPWGISSREMLEAEKADGFEPWSAMDPMYIFNDVPVYGETAQLMYRFAGDRLSYILYSFGVFADGEMMQGVLDRITGEYGEANLDDEELLVRLLTVGGAIDEGAFRTIKKEAWTLPDNRTLLVALESEGSYGLVLIDSLVSEPELAPSPDPAPSPDAAGSADPSAEAMVEVRYDLNEDGQAVIAGGRGKGSLLVIPAELDGHPVAGIKPFAFHDWESLVSVSMPDTLVTIGESAFSGCRQLTTVAMPDTLAVIGENAFRNCTSLAGVTLPLHLKEIKFSAFNGCESLTEIEIPSETGIVGDAAFADCKSLASVTFAGERCELGEALFSGCRALSHVALPAKLDRIEGYLFFECTGLKEISIPDRVEFIGRAAFSGCRSLVSVVLPDSVRELDGTVFYNCFGLESLTIPAGVESIGIAAIHSYNRATRSEEPLAGVTILVDAGSYAEQYCIDNAFRYTVRNR